ncbi:RNA polymerase sigma factor [Sphingobacterium suaedae]|uniref:RNA polymerase sigma factor n=1 Tax=Sphingobacterium suaedae TaxID=1686402 RepID=A0ABW5KDN6_9SPHI
MNDLSDRELLVEIQQDNRLAFRELVDRYADLLFNFVNSRIQNTADAEDILQDIFASFWSRRNRITVDDTLYPYLFKAARYETIDWIAKHNKHLSSLASLLETGAWSNALNSCEEEFLAKELAQLIEKEVDAMPTTMKSVFRMSRNSTMSIKDIAVELALSEQTVKNNITLALNKLKVRFK